jgi:hypothetical protein
MIICGLLYQYWSLSGNLPGFSCVENTYSQPFIKRSPLGQRKSRLIKQVTS